MLVVVYHNQIYLVNTAQSYIFWYFDVGIEAMGDRNPKTKSIFDETVNNILVLIRTRITNGFGLGLD